jgi:TRAP-type C4-dicarboxylate transport system substrate-binding protein
MTERTNGKFKLRYHYSQSLVPTKEEPAALRSGLSQMASMFTQQLPQPYPLYDYINFPWAVPGDSLEHIYAMVVAANFNPIVERDLGGMNIRWLVNTPAIGGFNIWDNIPIRTLEDLQGRKQRWTGINATIFERFGVQVVPVTYPEIYPSAKTGVIDGYGLHLYLGPLLNLADVSKYVTVDIELQSGAAKGNFVNLDVWNALPDDIKKIAIESAIEADIWSVENAKKKYAAGAAYAEENMEEVIHFPPEELAKLLEIGTAGLPEKWLAEMEDKGLGAPAKELIAWVAEQKAAIQAMTPEQAMDWAIALRRSHM